ncbi:hypothetical protein EDD18DRAFT_1109927 [Armillaria luteobubalina]|uniref:Uncharacterized protein n=1 Tax=Armillaria luteobubalina TaxID=153913 RepID=A0AA39PSK7_9AGAR|nr:hypothetical protein EDD18DRAFT_1109927 [Armillaria luteobubalina]
MYKCRQWNSLLSWILSSRKKEHKGEGHAMLAHYIDRKNRNWKQSLLAIQFKRDRRASSPFLDFKFVYASNGDLAWRDTSRLSSSTIGASDRPFQQMLVARKLGIIGTQGNDTEDQRKLHTMTPSANNANYIRPRRSRVRCSA